MSPIDGRAMAFALSQRTATDVAALSKRGVHVGFAVVLVGSDPASEIYVSRKVAESERVGIVSFKHRLPADTSEATLLALIDMLNGDPAVHGVLVQLPLPKTIEAGRVLDAIEPDKDVDGFHPVNVGRLSSGTVGLVPCTPLGCMMLLTA